MEGIPKVTTYLGHRFSGRPQKRKAMELKEKNKEKIVCLRGS